MNLFAEVTEEFANLRIDVFLKSALGDDLSRAMVQKWVKSGNVTKMLKKPESFPDSKSDLSNEAEMKHSHVDKIILKPNYIVSTGEKFNVEIPPKPKTNLQSINMNLTVVKDFKNFMIIDKPVGIPTHSGPGDDSPSLINGLLYQFKDLSVGSDESRPGIVHRLDKPTSGLLIIAKNDIAHYQLAKLFQERKIYKRYYAWIMNSPKEASGTIQLPIGRHPVERLKMCVTEKGRMAITHYKLIKYQVGKTGQKYSLVELEIETGRTHQIRVHLQNLGCPLVGDTLYSKSGLKFAKFGLLLFAQKLAFDNPFEQEAIEVELPFPERFIEFEKSIGRY